jgi:hypothetical protein
MVILLLAPYRLRLHSITERKRELLPGIARLPICHARTVNADVPEE